MARVRSGGGGNGPIWGLVVFGAGFFICLILAIVFYTQVSGAREAESAARADLQRIMTSADGNHPVVAAAQADGQPGSVTSKLAALVEDLRSQVNGLQGEVQTLQGSLAAARTNIETQRAATAQAQASYTAAVDDKNALEQELNQQVQALSSKIDAISAENTRLEGLIDTSIDELDATYAQQITGLRDQLAERDSSAADLTTTIGQLQDEIRELRGVTVDREAVTLADARIVSQIPDQNKVYLDIGRNQNLSLGMPFKVFDGDELVKIDDPAAEGKAIVEIINVEANSSIGRIIDRRPRAVINDGDILVNVVYDPNRVFTYHVFGQFDLDYDGEPEERGIDEVKSMINRFGGRLTDELSFSTDYVVLGVDPEFPQTPADELDLIQMREYRVQLENYQAYQDRITRAQELGIPVLNQSRFLDLVGYFER